MKKFWKSLTCLILSLVCFSGVACSSLDVESVDFYTNFIEQISEVEKFTFDLSVNTQENLETGEMKAVGGVSFEEENFYFAGEVTITEKDSLGKINQEIENIYLYKDKMYFKEGNLLNNGSTNYRYEVVDIDSEDNDDELVNELTANITEFVEAIRNNKKEKISEFTKESFEILFTANKTDDGYEIALDAEKIKSFYSNLKLLTVKELIDKYYGENAFQELKDDVNEFLNKTVGEVKQEINDNSNNLFDVVLEKLVDIVLKEAGVENTTAKEKIEEVLSEYGNKKMSAVLAEISGESEQEIKKYIGAFWGMCESSTLFEITETSSKTIEIIEGYIIDYADNVNIVINFDKKGNLINSRVQVKDIIIDDVKIVAGFKIEFGKEFENIASKTASISAHYIP